MEPNVIQSTLKKIRDKVAGDPNREMSEKLDQWWESSSNGRKEVDWKWFNYDLWVSGNHYAKWDKGTQQILSVPKKDGKPKVVINKIYTTLRGVRSFVLQNKPKAEVTPYNLDPQNLEQVVTLNQYCDYLHDKLQLRTKLRATMWHALKYSVGFWQVLYDDEENDGEGEIVVNVVDPYDLYWDPLARFPSEARFVVLAISRPIEVLKEDPKYKDADWSKVQSDKQMAASTLKARTLQHEKGNYQTSDKDDGTVIVKEFWYTKRVQIEETDQTGQKITRTQKKVYICTKAGGQIIRPEEETDLTRLPFFRLPSDIEPMQMYGTGWVKHMISPNRELNRTESSIAEYNTVVNKARVLAEKGHGIRVMTNQHGEIVEHKRNIKVTPFQTPQLGVEAENATIRYNRYLEDTGALHDASMGRQSSADQSGRSIEALQEGDSNNLSELLENTEEFLEEVFEYILSLASQKYQFARSVVTTTRTGEKEFVKIIGEGAQPELQQVQGATIIPKKNIVDVKIGSMLAYTSEGRRMAVKDLATILPNLPPEVILEAYAVGNIADIIMKMQKQAEAQRQAEAAAAAQQAQVQATTQLATQQTQTQLDEERAEKGKAGETEAIAFIRSVINGQKPPMPKNVGASFINYLDHFMSSEEGQAAGGAILSVLQTLRDQAMLQMKDNVDNVKSVT